MNLIVFCEAIPSEILVTIEHSNCFITTLQTAAMHSRIVATNHLYKCARILTTNLLGLKIS